MTIGFNPANTAPRYNQPAFGVKWAGTAKQCLKAKDRYLAMAKKRGVDENRAINQLEELTRGRIRKRKGPFAARSEVVREHGEIRLADMNRTRADK